MIDVRAADGKDERLPDLASELVRLKVDVIVAAGTPAALAAPELLVEVEAVAVLGAGA